MAAGDCNACRDEGPVAALADAGAAAGVTRERMRQVKKLALIWRAGLIPAPSTSLVSL